MKERNKPSRDQKKPAKSKQAENSNGKNSQKDTGQKKSTTDANN